MENPFTPANSHIFVPSVVLLTQRPHIRSMAVQFMYHALRSSGVALNAEVATAAIAEAAPSASSIVLNIARQHMSQTWGSSCRTDARHALML